jgi:Flp pilus assembly protein TadD
LAGELDLVGQTEEAEHLYREAVELFPEEPSAYEKIVAFLERQSRGEEAGPFREQLRQPTP